MGVASIIIGFVFFYHLKFENTGTLYVAIGIGFFTWALAIKSESIIKETNALVTKTNDLVSSSNNLINKINENTNKSHKLIKTIGTGIVLENISNINDWRLSLRDKLIKIKLIKPPISRIIIQDYINQHSFIIWKTLTFVNRIFRFDEHFDIEEKRNLIHEIDCLFIDLWDGKIFFNIIIDENYKKQLQKIYDKISSLDVFKEKSDRVKRLKLNLSFLKDESDEFMGFDNKPINIKKLREQAENKRKASKRKK